MNPEHVEIVRQGPDAINAWRNEHPGVRLNLSAQRHAGADFRDANLSGANLEYADLQGVDFRGAQLIRTNLDDSVLVGADFESASLLEATLRFATLSGACFKRAVLAGSHLSGASLAFTDFTNANLNDAYLGWAHFLGAQLDGATLNKAHFQYADFSESSLVDSSLAGADLFFTRIYQCNLDGADFSDAQLYGTLLGVVDLSSVKGLDTVRVAGPCSLGIDTLYLSKGKIPASFLTKCGVPDNLIKYLPSLLCSQEAIQFYSCFISYSHKDEEFCKRLYSRMRDEHLRVWYAPEDMAGGQKLHVQIDEAIRLHDKLLLVLSKSSMGSEWVKTEICKARARERREGRQVLFPIRLVSFERIRDWEAFDADSGKDMAVEIREYYIPDFSNWKDDDAFEEAFARLLKDLKASAE